MNTEGKIAVIGAGIFGCEAALTLQKTGYSVVLFEKSAQIISGATTKSQNRLHLGLHYPRDIQTAMQSIRGYETFSARFPECVDTTFENYYALAAENSKIDLKKFNEFILNTGIKVHHVDLDALAKTGLKPDRISGLWKCEEGVIDFVSLRMQLENEMEEYGVERSFSNEVLTLEQKENFTELMSKERGIERFDYVVRSTYGSDRIKMLNSSLPKRIYEYHQTLILKTETSLSRQGITIIDGDFLTLLPYGKTKDSLLYSPTGSVREKHIGTQYPSTWDEITNDHYKPKEAEIIERFEEWLPNLEIAKEREFLTTVRSIEPNMQSTDRRTSAVTQVSKNIIDIWSGKIDHCVDIAMDVASKVSGNKNVQ